MTMTIVRCTLHLLVLWAVSPRVARGQTPIGLTVDPAEGSVRVLTPTTNLSITCFWDALETTDASGVLDLDTELNRTSMSLATAASPGKAVFEITGSSLSLGNHTVVLRAWYITIVMSGGKKKKPVNQTIEETVSVIVYNEQPITGLRLTHANRFYDIVGDTTKITANVTTGTAITADWLFDADSYLQEVNNDASPTSFTYPHVWKDAGVFPVYLNASNRVSNDSTQANVTVFHPINGLNFFTTSTILQTLEELVLTLEIASDMKNPMGNVTFNLTWGDGDWQFDVLNITAGQSLVFRHNYTVQSDRNGNLELASTVQTKVSSFPVRVWDKLNVTLHMSARVGKPGDNFTLTFVNPPRSGFQYVISCNGDHLFSNTETALYANFSPPTPPYKVSFGKVGLYTITLNAFNPLYTYNTDYLIIVENPIKPQHLTILPANQIISIPDGSINLKAKAVDKSYLTTAFCAWDSGQNDTAGAGYLQLPTDFPVEKMYTFDSARNYTVSLHCWNNISEATVHSVVTARSWNMTEFKLSYENLQIMDGMYPKQGVLFTLSLLDINSPPTGLNAVFTYGDGNSLSQEMQGWTHIYTYPSRNVYNGTLLLTHPDKGNISLNLSMRVGAFQIAVESSGGLVMSHEFRFIVSVPRNFTGNATVNFGDGTSTWNYKKVGTLWIFSHIYQLVGYYQASLTGYGLLINPTSNHSFTEKVEFETLEVEGSVKDMNLLVVPTETYQPPANATAYIWLDRTQHRVMSMNCSLDWNEIMDEYIWTWTDSMEPSSDFMQGKRFQYNYITLGTKEPILSCSNAYSSKNVTREVFVNNDCFSPDPIFDRQYSKLAKPMTVLNSGKVKLVTRTVIKCTDIKPNFTWAIKIVRNRSVLAFDYPNLDYLTWEPGQLEPDLYRFSLNISFGREHDFCWLSEMIYIRVDRAPLVVDIQGGKVRKTGDPHVIVDAHTGSYDPTRGYGYNEGFVFTWTCRTYNSTSVEELLSLDATASSLSSIPCDIISNETEAGKRQLNIPDSAKAVGFMFQVDVSYDDMTSNTSAYVQFIRGSLSIEINCILNCGMKTALSSKLVLSVTCDSCTQEQMVVAGYVWKIFKVNNSTNESKVEILDTSIFEPKDAYSGRGSVIKENVLEGCQTYRVEVNMTLPADNSTGFAAWEFRTNCPPWGGNCTVTPLQGQVMTDYFSMFCVGWKDEGVSDAINGTRDVDLLLSPLVYKFLLRRNVTVFPLAEGGESKMPRVMLPLIPGTEDSEYELVARIFDPWNDFVEVSQPINLIFDNSISLGETLTFWDGQAFYTNSSSTLTKQMRGLTIASSLISQYNVSDNQTKLQIAQESSSGSSEYVLNADWKDIWYELQNPPSAPNKDNLTSVTDEFIDMVWIRGEDAKNLSGYGLTALAEGLSIILLNPATTSPDSVEAAVELLQMATESLQTLCSTKPYPIIENLKESVSAMTALLDRLIAASIPSYDIADGSGIVFNSSDISVDDKHFIQESLGIVSAVKDQQKIELIQKVLPRLEETIQAMHNCLLAGMVVGQNAEMVERGGVSLMATKMTGISLSSSTIVADTNTVLLGIGSGTDTYSDQNGEVEVKATVYTQNPYAWSSDSSSYNITSPVVRVDLRDSNGTRALSTLSMTIKRGSKVPLPSLGSFLSNDTRGGFDNLLYHRLSVPSLYSTLVTYMQLPLEMADVVAYFRSGNAPSLDRYDFKTEGNLVRYPERELALSPEENMTTLKFVVPASILNVGAAVVGFHIAESNVTFAYKYLSFTDSCFVWDETNLKWVPACKLSSAPTATETVCTCENPPGVAFGSGFLVPPNTIDFTLVFSKFDANNASVYGTLIGLLLAWVLVVVWARRQEKKDKERWSVSFLKDNPAGESYLYLLTVHTGLKRGSGTTSNVSFVLGGSSSDSGIRVLSDGTRTLETGSVLRYIMATDSCLGHLDYVRIWHDNSGGSRAGWFLRRIDVEDLQTGHRYLFVCEQWLAVDKDNGVVDRFVPLAQKDEIMSFDKLFSEYTKIGITDTHLWLSCFMRPSPSSFTRVQRVSCCLVLLLLIMITSAMFYKTEDSETGASTNSEGTVVKIAFLRFSVTTLWTSSVSIIITSIPMLIFVLIFRNYRPSSGPRASAKKDLKGEVTEATQLSETPEHKEKMGKFEESLKDSVGINLQTNLLPHYWCYIGWLLLLGTAGTCAFFLVLYSMQWGITTSEEWLTSFVASFFESVFVIDPVKVIIVACLLAFCAQNPYTAQSQDEDGGFERVQVETTTLSSGKTDPMTVPPDPVSANVLAESRKRLLKEHESHRVFYDLLLHSFFVFCIFSLSYGNRDLKAFTQNNHLDNLLYSSLGDAPFPFQSITRREEVMRWMKETMLPVLFPRTDSLGNSLQLRERVFTSDPTSFRVGPVRVRQLRMSLRKRTRMIKGYSSLLGKPHYCPPYSMEQEERGMYCVGWKPLASCSYEERSTKLSREAWKYQSFEGLSSLPVWGTYSVYSSGGYVMDFSVNWDVINLTLQELEEKNWLGEQTRVVFVEFSLYNPDSNLFSYLRLSAEFPETGAAFIGRELKTFHIYQHLQAIGFYMYIVEIISAFGVLVFTIKIAIKIKQQKLLYFSNSWQMLDLVIVLISYGAIAFYAIKTRSSNDSMAAWRDNPKQYVDFYQTAFWDDMYGYWLGAVVFVTTIRLLRILGYNRRLTMIAAVLANSGRDLFGFSLVFVIVFMAYLVAGYFVFSSTLSEFRTPLDSAYALCQMLLGRNVLAVFSEDLEMFAWVFFISYVILVFMILMTMFQAILCGTSTTVRTEISSIQAPYGLTNMFVKVSHIIADLLPAWLVRGRRGPVERHSQSAGDTQQQTKGSRTHNSGLPSIPVDTID